MRTKSSRNKWNKERSCIHCGKIDIVRKDNISNCCVSCAARIRSSGEKANLSRISRMTSVIVPCSRCGKDTPRTQSQLRRSAKHYCSVDCRYHPENRIDRVCNFCCKTFNVAKGVLSGKTNASANFCSRPCYNSWLCRTDRITGRGSQWRNIRNGVLSKSPFCGWCGTVRGVIQVHHIVPFRLTFCNDVKNLIPLCLKCHKTIEVITVSVESISETPHDIFKVMSLILRQRQAATLCLLKRVYLNERSKRVP